MKSLPNMGKTVWVAGVVVMTTAPVAMFDAICNALDAAQEMDKVYLRTGRMDRSEVNRLVKDIVGLCNGAVDEWAVYNWIMDCTA